MRKEIKIIFHPGDNAAVRNEQIAKFFEFKHVSIYEGWLHKEGLDPIEYGYGDADLEAADYIIVIYNEFE